MGNRFGTIVPVMLLRATVLAGLLLFAANSQGGCESVASSGCRSTRAAAVEVVAFAGNEARPKPKPPKKPQKERVFNCSPSESDFWQGLKPYKRGWKTDGKGNFYQWDYTHNDIEWWRKQGSTLHHKGSINPQTGLPYKGPKHKPMKLPW
ncbi:hypothetical protein TH66_04875 [Carbonactinospora thermoautotrophica]|uniref:Colicin E3-like ribonuclease domain-containing protein n=2 Tax=Carbonactinospora thermoautotrophica TaxID=1469144 RepID=A0A132N4Q4_9ACTN|nr:colicin E3/pyocin S6 family cytotoxin [Carbonactinospora thermoautotrophica]KWX05073.1 hypothetical protein TH66_04875 [Carbonactinospora thermoautotrophica]